MKIKKIFKSAAILPLAIIIAFSLTLLPMSSELGGKNTADARDMEGQEKMSTEEFLEKTANTAVPFIESRGLHGESVSYFADIFTGTFFITSNGLVYAIGGEKATSFGEFFVDNNGNYISLEPSAEDMAETKMNYYKGNDQSKWREGLPTYNTVSLGELYPNIDVKLNAHSNNVEKLFYVNKGGNHEDINLKFEGVDGLKIEDNKLIIKTEHGPISMSAPEAYQEIGGEKKEVEVNYELRENNSYGFVLGDYDKNETLVIDPLLYSTYLGGSGDDYGLDIILDSFGNMIIVGTSDSSDFPTAFNIDNPFIKEAFAQATPEADAAKVTKMPPSGDSVTAVASMAGTDPDKNSVAKSAVDDSEASGGTTSSYYITGHTNASDFPTTLGAYDTTYNYAKDAFVARLDISLNIINSTFIGGGHEDMYHNEYGDDIGEDIIVDSSGYVFIVGTTQDDSTPFPTTSGAYQETSMGIGAEDPFVSKFESDLSDPDGEGPLTGLVASTLCGGYEFDYGYGIDLDSSGNVFITGKTMSSDFPTAGLPYQSSIAGFFYNAFVSNLSSDLTTLTASTYLGGANQADVGKKIAIDNSNDVIYVTGYTQSDDFPMATFGYDKTHNGGSDAFISQLNLSLSMLHASTYYGGSGDDYGEDIICFGGDNVYIAGITNSGDLPMTSSSYEEYYTGGQDGFTARFNQLLSSLTASTYIGGSSDDEVFGLTADSSGNVYVAGYTYSSDYPTASYDDTYNGGGDMIISELDGDLSGDGGNGGAIPEYTTPLAIALALGVSFLVIILVRQRMLKKKKAEIKK